MISEVKTEKHMDAFGLGDRQTGLITWRVLIGWKLARVWGPPE